MKAELLPSFQFFLKVLRFDLSLRCVASGAPRGECLAFRKIRRQVLEPFFGWKLRSEGQCTGF